MKNLLEDLFIAAVVGGAAGAEPELADIGLVILGTAITVAILIVLLV